MFYLDLFRALDEHEVSYALVGGVAMNLYGVPRMTMDVDIVADLGRENVLRLIRAVESMGLKPRAPVAAEELADPAKRASWISEKNMIAFSFAPDSAEFAPLDVLISTPVAPIQIIARAVVRKVGDVPVRLAAAQDLIRLKEGTGRVQDRADIEHLRKVCGGPVR